MGPRVQSKLKMNQRISLRSELNIMGTHTGQLRDKAQLRNRTATVQTLVSHLPSLFKAAFVTVCVGLKNKWFSATLQTTTLLIQRMLMVHTPLQPVQLSNKIHRPKIAFP